ncbi:MAG: hypothetical protein KGJ02_08715 [Verrucomicrobiota bacterium]|nr:hypothetical protein [Verrucomicrobiota bacterium]
MNKKLAIALFSLATTLGFAQDAPTVQNTVQPNALPLEIKIEKKSPIRKSYGYVRMGISDSDAIHEVQTLPGLGAGYRLGVSNAVVDFSANYTRQSLTDNHSPYFYTAPKVAYLRYAKEFYYGAGLAWGGLKNEKTNFMGLVPNLSVGYQMPSSFVQLDVSQPAVALNPNSPKTLYASVSNLPGPLVEASFGVGF